MMESTTKEQRRNTPPRLPSVTSSSSLFSPFNIITLSLFLACSLFHSSSVLSPSLYFYHCVLTHVRRSVQEEQEVDIVEEHARENNDVVV